MHFCCRRNEFFKKQFQKLARIEPKFFFFYNFISLEVLLRWNISAPFPNSKMVGNYRIPLSGIFSTAQLCFEGGGKTQFSLKYNLNDLWVGTILVGVAIIILVSTWNIFPSTWIFLLCLPPIIISDTVFSCGCVLPLHGLNVEPLNSTLLHSRIFQTLKKNLLKHDNNPLDWLGSTVE